MTPPIRFNLNAILFFTFLFLGFVGDVIIVFNPDMLGLNQVLRSAGFIPIIFVLARQRRSISLLLLITVGLLLFSISFLVYYISGALSQEYLRSFFSTLVWAGKNFGFLLVFVFYVGAFDDERSRRSILAVLVFFSLLYIVIQISGAIFSVESFMTYGEGGYRSGYKGVIYAQNEASAFYFFSGVIVYEFFRKSGKSIRMLSFFIVCFSLFVLGTKAGWGFLMIFVVYVFYTEFGLRRSLLFLFSFFAVQSILVIYMYNINPLFKEAADLSIGYYRYKLSVNQSLLSVLTSGRNDLFMNVFEWSFTHMPTFPFTGGVPITRLFVEMDFFDIVLVFGLPFAIIYFSYIYKCFDAKNNRLLFLSFILASFIAGHLTYSIVAAPFISGSFLSMHTINK